MNSARERGPSDHAFSVQFAAGHVVRGICSDVWRVSAPRAAPELRLQIMEPGLALSAKLHCPIGRPWSRSGKIGLKGTHGQTFTWPGALVEAGASLEWRILTPGVALRSPALPVLNGVRLIPPPTPDEWLAITLTLGANGEPQEQAGVSGLVAALSLRDGRHVWVRWYKVPLETWPLPRQSAVPKERQQFEPAVAGAVAAGRAVAVYAGDVWSDGSFAFYRMSV